MNTEEHANKVVEVNPIAPSKERVLEGLLVVGGGYAGVHAATAAAKRGVVVTILDPSPTHDFVTRLAAVAGGTSPRSSASIPLCEIAARHLSGTAIDIDDGRVVLGNGTTVTPEAIVVAVGARPTSPPIPGIENLLPLRTADDAFAIDEALGMATEVTVLGAGPTGVQLAGAIAVAHPKLSVSLIEQECRLLPGMHPSLSQRAAKILRQRGVNVRVGTSMDSADATGVDLSSGDRLMGPAIWAGGFEAASDVVTRGERGDDGQVELEPDLRVRWHRSTFAAGDVAIHRTAEGQVLPMSAQIAVQAGRQAGENAARTLRGEPVKQAELRSRGWVLDLSGGRGVAQLGRIRLAAPVLDRLPPILHRTIDAKNLVQVAGPGALI